MSDATLETVDGRAALRFERLIRHPIERVWRAISVPGELEQWFPAAVPWGPTPGESLEAGGMTGQVVEVEAPYRLAWTFASDSYLFELSESGDSTRLVFVHVFDDRAIAAQTAAGWEVYLNRLTPLLDGNPLSEEEGHAGWEDVHERYAERFDLDPAPGREFARRLRSSE